MRAISGSMCASVHAQDTLPMTYQAAYLRAAAEYAALVGIEPARVVAQQEEAQMDRLRLAVQCVAEGHTLRPWCILGDANDQRDVCARCGERL